MYMWVYVCVRLPLPHSAWCACGVIEGSCEGGIHTVDTFFDTWSESMYDWFIAMYILHSFSVCWSGLITMPRTPLQHPRGKKRLHRLANLELCDWCALLLSRALKLSPRIITVATQQVPSLHCSSVGFTSPLYTKLQLWTLITSEY